VRPAPLSAAIGLALDAAYGDPPSKWHPVAWFGAALTRLEEAVYRDERNAGAVYTSIGVFGATAIAQVLDIATLWSALAIGGKSLDSAAAKIQSSLAEGDLEAARDHLPWLVGRDPTNLNEAEISRAVIESVAENTVDAVIAPLFWASLFGTHGVVAYRAVNTLDAMVGYHNDRYENFGWASARLEDLANYVPARLAVAAVCAVRPQKASHILRMVARDASRHPSPNAGQIETAFAAALGIRLGGTNSYRTHTEQRATLGDGEPPQRHDIVGARSLLRDVSVAAGTFCAVIGLARFGLSARGRARP
jgi:adenosylcobinamide-phosphate synthase